MLLIGMVSTAALTACSNMGPTPPAPTASTEAPHPIEVSLERMRHPIPASSERFEGAERDALLLFLDQSGAQRGDRVSLLVGPDATSRKLIVQVTSELESRGLNVSVAPGAPAANAAIEVIVEHYRAHPVDCPDWSKWPGGDPANRVDSNFGCATQAELAAMVADPHDLIVGREAGLQTGEPASRPVELYRAGRVAPLGASASASGGGGAGGAGNSGGAAGAGAAPAGGSPQGGA